MNDVAGTGQRPRCRDVGLIIGQMEPGPLNAITDVPGVMVGHSTIIRGEGALVPGQGPVRTGVTVILPHPGNVFKDKVRGAIHVINGFGKATGIAQVQELGVIETPIALTNTLSVGTVWDAVCEYTLEQNPEIGVTTGTLNPVVLECNDGYLNDIRGRHVKKEHVFEALGASRTGIVDEGNVGAGTGMSCLGFKGGIGTSSRRLPCGLSAATVGVLVLANFGRLENLLIKGVPVGLELQKYVEDSDSTPPGSVVVVVATDAPLSERQLLRVAKRCMGGLARVGSAFANGSGDFVVAFSTKNKVSHWGCGEEQVSFVRDDSPVLGAVFQAAVEATEEAVLNALFRARTMVGRDNHIRAGIPIDKVCEILRRFHAM
ncbi:MAG TPA: P1 family peptidase [Firmicutes bacterium]|nr:P1 family peptidase [Candidatus Fermentithermobacillaceae bacterium]